MIPRPFSRRRSARPAGRPAVRPVPAAVGAASPTEDLETRALLTTFVVDTAFDVVSETDGTLSLREAITAAETNEAFSDAPAGDFEGDIITFDLPGGAETVTLSLGALPALTDDLEIDGGDGVTIEQVAGEAIFESVGVQEFMFSNLTFTGGEAEAGGAFTVTDAAIVTLNDVFFEDNVATGDDMGGGALFVTGESDVRMSGGAFLNNLATEDDSGSGGAVFVNGASSFFADGTRFDGNMADRAGGAIEVAEMSQVRLDDVLATRNTATGDDDGPGNGGFLHATGEGNVVLVRGGNFALNEAGNQGGALWNSENSTLSVRDATFSTNTAAGGDGVGDDDGPDGGGAIYNDGGLADVRDSVFFRNEATGDAGTGGAIFSDSGRLRVVGGSFNRNTAPRAGGAIEVTEGDADVVNARFLSNETGTPMTEEESLNGNPGNGGALHVGGDATVTVSGGDARQNFAANQGGAFWNGVDGVLRLVGLSITNNEAAGGDSGDGGGAVYNDGDDDSEDAGQLRIDDVFIARNTATGDEGSGGALLLAGGTTIVRDSNFASNSAVRAGGAIEMLNGDLRVRDSFLRNNFAGDEDLDLPAAPGNGGGIHIVGGDDSLAIFSGGGIFGNDAANEGGGVWVGDGARVCCRTT